MSVKRAISWKKTGKRALKEREVRRAFFRHVSPFIPRRQMEFSVLQTSGSRYALQLLAGSCSDSLGALEKTSQLVPTTTESVFAPDSVIAVRERGIWWEGGVDLLLPPMSLSSITTFSEMTGEWKLRGTRWISDTSCSFVTVGALVPVKWRPE